MTTLDLNNTPQEQLNKEMDRYREIIIKLMDDDLRSGERYEEIKGDLRYDVVGNIGIVIYKGKLYLFYKYSKSNGIEYFSNLPGLEEAEDLAFGEQESGYELNNQKIFRNGEEIVQFLIDGGINPEFVKAVDDINFYINLQGAFGMIKAIMNGKKLEVLSSDDEYNKFIEYMYHYIITGAVRIKDVMYFRGKGYIPKDEDFVRLLKRAILELPNQCSDLRFYKNALGERMGMEVTKEELDQYLKPEEGDPLITQEMYNNCLERIKARDKYIAERKSTREETWNQLNTQ